ncbi:MAG: tail fiber protein [Leptolyngbyaceae cyanobacterium MO_188.B28]|nr:tail fiber protein [Leptolyngbyaceae cyanobacterium MO_188.B28]
MAEPFLAEIRIWANTFAPRGWSYCDGQILPIAQNTALFSLLGTTFGGDGRTTFGIPDLRGRGPLNIGGNSGQGPGLSNHSWGERSGAATVTLTQANLPAHNHLLKAVQEPGDNASPNGAYIAGDTTVTGREYAETTVPNVSLNSSQLENVGGGQAHNNMQPYLALGFCIALIGLFPSRSW